MARVLWTTREIARLNSLLAEKDQTIQDLHREAAGWQAQAERHMERIALVVKMLKDEETQ